MNLADFKKYDRSQALKEYKSLRYIKENKSYFLYLIFNAEVCVYVGETSNLFWRLIKHKAKCSQESVIYLKEYADKATVLQQEKHYIRMLKPIFNIRYCSASQLELFAL